MITLSEYLLRFIGHPYIWGGNGSGSCHGGFDCSGLVLEGLWALGLYGGGDVTAQTLCDTLAQTGWNRVPSSRIKANDIIFFGKSRNQITHVSVAVTDKLMVEAGGGGSKCSSETKSTGFVRVRPINTRRDLVEVLRE